MVRWAETKEKEEDGYYYKALFKVTSQLHIFSTEKVAQSKQKMMRPLLQYT